MTTVARYAFDNALHQARRPAAIETTLDPGSIRLLEDRGVGAGWRCLVVGAGCGSKAAWLSDRVGPSGSVVATDVDTRFLDGLDRPNLEIWRHDVVRDALPAAAFDLVHVRLVLARLAERRRALERMVAALKPGGWLVAEEMDFASVLPVNGDGSAALFQKLVRAHHAILTQRGFDPFYGRALANDLRSAGLCALGTEGRSFIRTGGSAPAAAWAQTFERLRQDLLGAGLATERELAEALTLLYDPGFAFLSQTTMAAWGRRPVA